MPRLPFWFCAAAVVLAMAPLSARDSAAGSSRAVIGVTARVVHACTVSAPDATGGAPTVDQHCTSSATVPHTVSTQSIAPATDADATRPATGDTLVVTVTY